MTINRLNLFFLTQSIYLFKILKKKKFSFPKCLDAQVYNIKYIIYIKADHHEMIPFFDTKLIFRMNRKN